MIRGCPGGGDFVAAVWKEAEARVKRAGEERQEESSR